MPVEDLFYIDLPDDLLNSARESFGNDLILLKGDISGIQNFIFDIKSEGAARELKARSAFIDILLNVVEQEIKDLSDIETIQIINTGGNFYLFVKPYQNFQTDLDLLRSQYETLLAPLNLHLFIAAITLSVNDDYKSSIEQLENLLSRMKLKPWINFDYFTPQALKTVYNWKDLAGKIINSMSEFGISYFNVVKSDSEPTIDFSKKATIISKYKISFLKTPKDGSKELFINIPKWHDGLYNYCYTPKDKQSSNTNSVLEFENLANLAKLRGNEDNLCACAFDLDNMGEFLKIINSFESFQSFSIRIKESFQINISKILKQFYDRRPKKIGSTELECYYKDNIYVVYNGGDDALILGPWDAVWDFMNEFSKEFNKTLNSEDLNLPFTFSTAMVFFKNKYPIKRIAEMLEENLTAAKQTLNSFSLNTIYTGLKNEIRIDKKGTWNIFGINFNGEQYRDISAKVKELLSLLKNDFNEKGLGKILLHRIRETAVTYESMIERQDYNMPFENPEIYQISYSMRYFSGYNAREIATNFEEYFLFGILNDVDKNSGYIYPVAARFAEWKLKEKNK